MNRNLIALGITLGTLLLAPVTQAQVQRAYAENGDSSYFFDTQNLNATGFVSEGERLTIRPGAARVQLIRPRVSFLGELAKSVEHL